MAKKESRLVFVEGKRWLVNGIIPSDYGKEEIGQAIKDNIVRIVAVKALEGPMDERVWMDLTPSRLANEENYRLNNLVKMKNIWHINMPDSEIINWVQHEKSTRFPQSATIKVGDEIADVVEVDGKYYIHAEKTCQVCGIKIAGTRQVYKKGDGFTYPQMFQPDPQFAGAVPAKFKSKFWVCKDHAPVDVTEETKGEYKAPGVTIPAPKKVHKAVVTPHEYDDLKHEIKDLKGALRALKKNSFTIAELEAKFWDMTGEADSADLGAIAKFIKALKK